MQSINRVRIILTALTLFSAFAVQMAVSPVEHASASDDCSGTSYTWTAKGDATSWTDAKNWDPSSDYPGVCANDSATITPLPILAFVNLTVPAITLNTLTLTRQSGTSGGGVELSGGPLTITSSFNWSVDGSVSTPLTVSGTATISGDSQNGSSLIESSINLAGMTTVSGTGLALTGTGSSILNTGTFTLEPGSSITSTVCCVSLAQFVNRGSVVIPSPLTGPGPDSVINGIAFIDRGTVNIGSNSTLELQIAPSTFASGVTFEGGGTLLVDNNAAVQLNGTVNLANGTTFTLGVDTNNSAGTLSGTGAIQGNGTFSWTGGTLTGGTANASLTVASTVHTSISSNNQKSLLADGTNSTTLRLAGSTTLSGTGLFLNGGGAHLNNTGTFSPRAGSAISSDSCCANPAQFNNQGTLTVDVGAGKTFSIPQPGQPGAAFTNSGTVDLKSGTFQFSDPGYVQTAGHTQLNGGSLASTSPTSAFVTLRDGDMTGSGTVTGDVVNKAIIDPGTSPSSDGIITVTGNYVQTSTGTLMTDIKSSGTAGTDYDQLAVTGKASLDGTLGYNLGSYVPKGTDAFTVTTYAKHSGQFATLKPAKPAPRYWVNYKPASAVFSYGPWGVDSKERITSSFYSSIQQNLGTPDFWGRYIGDSKTSFANSTCTQSANYAKYTKDIIPSEAATAHSNGLPILPVYFNYPTKAVKLKACGQNYARAAIEFAQHWAGPPIPQGTAIFVDIEGGVQTSADFIKAWYIEFNTTFSYTSPYDGKTYQYNAGYYKPGYYADTKDTNPSNLNFRSAYCGAVTQEPQIGTNSFIWTNRPGLNPTTKANEPAYQAVKPPCASQTLAWQYNGGTEMDNVDTDEAVTDLATLPLWHP